MHILDVKRDISYVLKHLELDVKIFISNTYIQVNSYTIFNKGWITSSMLEDYHFVFENSQGYM